MPRRVQDIVPGDRRSVRDIPARGEKVAETISHTKVEKKTPKIRGEISVKVHKVVEEKPEKEPAKRMAVTPPPEKEKKRSFKKKKLWIGIVVGVVVVVAVLAFFASTYYSRAVFTITPKSIPISVNSPLVIKAGTATAGGDLTYEVLMMKGSQSITVPATDGPAVSIKAEGKVNLYNSFSTSSARLIAGTRVANSGGLIYRLKSSVVIPGYTKPFGSTVAGSIGASIVADQPGAEYNLSKASAPTDFKIIAYKGGPRYDTIYAKLNSDIIGGAAGTKKTIAPAVLASTTAKLRSLMRTSLLQHVKDGVPQDYIMYNSSYTSAFGAPVIGGTEKNSATITLQGMVYGIIFKRTNLIAKLSGAQTVAAFGNLGYTASGLDNLTFSISNIKDFAPDKKGTLIINIKGDLTLTGVVPIEELKNALLGKSLAEFQVIMKKYSPVIENADGELVPPWSKIPNDTSRITINLKI
ncbi:MAG: hypothetical protein WCG02_03190 [Candidatus Taylorbacteria bacterium]